MTAVTGHLGATSVWSGTSAAGPSSGPTASAGAAGSPTPATHGYTMAEVAAHDSTQSCWAAIDGEVYNLTDWIDLHPGGREEILRLCGTDATIAFQRQHAGQPKPAERLAGYSLGP
nr:cytochrome b5-like heme/steroid binding domain-containing protein [Tessaracoccus coleopterorum]